jgi:hypothetical protein
VTATTGNWFDSFRESAGSDKWTTKWLLVLQGTGARLIHSPASNTLGVDALSCLPVAKRGKRLVKTTSIGTAQEKKDRWSTTKRDGCGRSTTVRRKKKKDKNKGIESKKIYQRADRIKKKSL